MGYLDYDNWMGNLFLISGIVLLCIWSIFGQEECNEETKIEYREEPTYLSENPEMLIISDTPCETVPCPQKYKGVYTLAYCMICKDDAKEVENE